MQGKTCMITGATSGIGFFTAQELARQGATVLIVGRHHEKTRQAVEQIQKNTRNHARMRFVNSPSNFMNAIFICMSSSITLDTCHGLLKKVLTGLK
jgi:NAD(P)-dependent dehydrogenase (short-subunit alcohol dehydrogenase family)